MFETKTSAKMNMFFSLLRSAMTKTVPDCPISPEKWGNVYSYAVQQRVVGLEFQGIRLLPASDRPPRPLFLKWACATETIQGQNQLLNGVAARLTEMFAAEGFRSAILKGPANARLYPDPFVRQCGDIDIWVEGGRQKVLDLLKRMGLLEDFPKISWFDYKTYRKELHKCLTHFSPHHFHLHQKFDGVAVEVHYRPASSVFNPFANRRLQRYLENEIKNIELVPEGFYVPSVKFALVMQLEHIHRHFFESGIGLKHLVDYYVLLQNASESERAEVSSVLRRFGVYRTASALMWVLEYIFKLDAQKMICEPNRKLGMIFLQEVVKGGAFGSFAPRQKRNAFIRWFARMHRPLQLFMFDPIEVFWSFINNWVEFVHLIPIRLKARKFSLKAYWS
ncbi:nucleotidyltransferase family protein [Fibrobacter sp. UWB12]|uniref:nucleotidyltransferase domain-containing protein n=1 Tax=Fibrobacter sp. UWB12 TaxID=1896203 RepID=UPI0009134E02|nr:nucleotidyltransferase family protein [Fibrobacter sp. UWB12]SHK67981.1 Uncharacterised nucleotidyltransferase [Fibrobacter sp. UWB12]